MTSGTVCWDFAVMLCVLWDALSIYTVNCTMLMGGTVMYQVILESHWCSTSGAPLDSIDWQAQGQHTSNAAWWRTNDKDRDRKKDKDIQLCITCKRIRENCIGKAWSDVIHFEWWCWIDFIFYLMSWFGWLPYYRYEMAKLRALLVMVASLRSGGSGCIKVWTPS